MITIFYVLELARQARQNDGIYSEHWGDGLFIVANTRDGQAAYTVAATQIGYRGDFADVYQALDCLLHFLRQAELAA